MNEYRTPEEAQVIAEHEAEVRAVLEQAVVDGVSLVVAMNLDEPADVVEQWINRLWNGLRDGLSDTRPNAGTLRIEDRLTAIVLLLKDRMDAEADRILDGIEGPR